MKQLLSILLSVTLLFSCQTTAVEDLDPKATYYRLAFDFYGDEATEYSRILKSVKTDNLRTDANVVVDGEVTLDHGSYGVVEIKSGVLTIDGDVTIQNINLINNGKDVTIHVTVAGVLRLGSSLNLNGATFVVNNGEIRSKSLEMQAGNIDPQSSKNEFINNGIYYIEGDAQITNGTSTFKNCGKLTVSANFNIHSGSYEACNCGTLTTIGMNVNSPNKITGKGFIEIQGNFNLNQTLTSSPDIILCYPGTINDPSKLGAAKRSCENTCTTLSLPVKYYDLQLIKDIISFKMTENINLYRMRVQQSLDGKAWKDLKEFHGLPATGLFEIKLGE